MKVIAIIPARAGSKRIIGKNKKFLYGKPLICYTIEEALKCEFIDEVIVSTDDEDILKICTKYFAYQYRFRVFPRPLELSQDNTPVWKVINHVAKELNLDNFVVILLLPTSPLRTKEDIKKGFELFKLTNKCIISVEKVDAGVYNRNGAVYIDWIKNIRKEKQGWHDHYHYSDWKDEYLYVMPRERSIDIDTIEDFKEAEKLMENYRNRIDI